MEYEFTEQKIDQHVEAVHVRVQPPIDAKADRIHLQEFYNRVSERQPRLFDSLAQQPGSFEIRKLLPIPGKGQMEVATFLLTPQGPVLSFPRRLPFLDDEVRWSDNLMDDIMTCLETLTECHGTWKILRIEKRREVIFATQARDSSSIIHKRFARGLPEDAQDVVVRWADNDDKYVRKISLTAMRRRDVVFQNVAGIHIQRQEPPAEYGIKVVVQVANRQAGRPLVRDDQRIILKHADEYYNETLLGILRGADDGRTA